MFLKCLEKSTKLIKINHRLDELFPSSFPSFHEKTVLLTRNALRIMRTFTSLYLTSMILKQKININDVLKIVSPVQL